jgi:putative ABC transport system permease protein
MESFFQDLRYGLRILLKNPGFTIVAVITLALGIGTNTAIFTVINSVLLRPLPYPEQERLFLIQSAKPDGSFDPMSDLEFTEYKKETQVFEHLAAFSAGLTNLTGAVDPIPVRRCEVTASFWPTLGVAPALGRTFLSEEDRSNGSMVVLSDKLWRAQFHADPHVLGKDITLDGTPHIVVEVMPPGFVFPLEVDLWSPVVLDTQNPKIALGGVVGRLKTGVSSSQAQVELDVISRRLASAFPERDPGSTLRMLSLQEHVVGNVRPSLLILQGAVGFVLLIACANLANLLLARGLGRRQELAVRACLDAGGFRLVRQLLTESLLLSLAAGL